MSFSRGNQELKLGRKPIDIDLIQTHFDEWLGLVLNEEPDI